MTEQLLNTQATTIEANETNIRTEQLEEALAMNALFDLAVEAEQINEHLDQALELSDDPNYNTEAIIASAELLTSMPELIVDGEVSQRGPSKTSTIVEHLVRIGNRKQ